MPKINLAEESARSEAVARRRALAYSGTLVILLLTVVAYGAGVFLTGMMQDRISTVEGEIRAFDAQLDARRADAQRIVLFRDRLESLNQVLDSHIYWTTVLTELERRFLPTATAFALEGSADSKEIELNVLVPTVDAAADIIASLQSKDGHETVFHAVRADRLSPADEAGVATGDAGRGYKLQLAITAKDTAFRQPQAAVVDTPVAPAATPANP